MAEEQQSEAELPPLKITPTAEKPALGDQDRAERRRLLAELALRPDELDRDTLQHIERLSAEQ